MKKTPLLKLTLNMLNVFVENTLHSSHCTCVWVHLRKMDSRFVVHNTVYFFCEKMLVLVNMAVKEQKQQLALN